MLLVFSQLAIRIEQVIKLKLGRPLLLLLRAKFHINIVQKSVQKRVAPAQPRTLATLLTRLAIRDGTLYLF